MKSPHESAWENETRRLTRETADREWQQLVAAARTPVWLWAGAVIAWLVLFAAIIYFETGPRFSSLHTLGVFFVMAVGQLWASARRREHALHRIIEREAPTLAEKLRSERVF